MAGAPPGPELDRDAQPRLWTLLSDLATRLEVPAPDAVFLIADANAYAIEDRRLFRSPRRHVLLGAGALHLLSAPQLAAVLAHELAHLRHGDTALAPVRNAARDFFGAAAHGLAGSSFGDLALRGLEATQQRSREAELKADAGAVSVVGRSLYTEALVRSTLGAELFNFFLQQDVAPLLEAGRVPDNLMEGFVPFLDEAAPTQGLGLSSLLAQAATQLGDSHPALMKRIAHVGTLPEPAALLVVDEVPATELVDGLGKLEQLATDAWAGRLPAMTGPLTPVSWGHVPDEVLAPWLVERSVLIANQVGKPPPEALRVLVERLKQTPPATLARELEPALAAADDGLASQLFAMFLGQLLAGVLLGRGGHVAYRPGTPAAVEVDGEAIVTGTLAAEALADEAARQRLLHLVSAT